MTKPQGDKTGSDGVARDLIGAVSSVCNASSSAKAAGQRQCRAYAGNIELRD